MEETQMTDNLETQMTAKQNRYVKVMMDGYVAEGITVARYRELLRAEESVGFLKREIERYKAERDKAEKIIEAIVNNKLKEWEDLGINFPRYANIDM